MHIKFEECSFIRYRDSEGVPNLNFKIGHVPQATPTWGVNLWPAGKNTPESTCTPSLKNVASSDTEILRGSQISFFSSRSLAPEPIRPKINRLRGTVEEYYCSEFQVIPIKRFLSRALTYIHTNIHTSKVKTISTPSALRARRR